MNIFEATKKGDIDAVRKCLANGRRRHNGSMWCRDVNAKSNDGNTALMEASWGGHADIAELLLMSGADVNGKNDYGNTALMWASCNGHVDVAKLLLQSGADVNAKDNNGDTALILASENGYADATELLLRSGADVNVKDNNGWTALMLASQNGRTDVAELLLRSGCKHPDGFGGCADVNAKDNDGNTALMWVSRYRYADIAKLLLRSGADINEKNDCGDTALILASQYGHADIAERIVSTAMRNPDVPYATVTLSSFVPRSKYMNARDCAGLVAKVIPIYLECAVGRGCPHHRCGRNAMFGRDMQRDVEEILDGKTETDREPLTYEDKKFLTKLLKTLRSIDYTDRVKSKDDENTVSVYDMEL